MVGYGTSAPPPPDAERQRKVFLDRFPHLHGQRILLFLSRIHPKKGVDAADRGFAAVPHADPLLQLVIVGPDQVGWQVLLQQRVSILGIPDRITWPGMLSGVPKWGAFRAAELFCLPSHQENFGIVVAEARPCALPVVIAEPVNIASEVCAAAAWLVHADTAAGTTDALCHLLAMPAHEQAEMGKRGLQLFQARFDFALVARILFPVLEVARRAP